MCFSVFHFGEYDLTLSQSARSIYLLHAGWIMGLMLLQRKVKTNEPSFENLNGTFEPLVRQ